MHICNICNYHTDKESNYSKHLKTNKHKIKIASERERIACDYCQNIFNNERLLIDHIKLCSKNPKNKLCKFCNIIFNKEINYNNHLELCSNNKLAELETNLKNKNTDNEKLNEEIKKLNEEIRKYCFDSSNRTNNSVNAQFNLYFNNAPPIKEIEDFNLYNKEELNEEGYLKFTDELIYYSEHKMLPKFIGDHIIKIYKKPDIKDQCVWSTDIARLNYMIKKAIDGWCTDKKGNEFVKLTIIPLLKFIECDVRQQIQMLAILSREPTLSNMQAHSLNKKCIKLHDVIEKIETSKIANDILIYISPFFHIDKKFIEQYTKNNNLNSLESNVNLFIEDEESNCDNEIKAICDKEEISDNEEVSDSDVQEISDEEEIILKPVITKKLPKHIPSNDKKVNPIIIVKEEIAENPINKKLTKVVSSSDIKIKPIGDKDEIIPKPIRKNKFTKV